MNNNTVDKIREIFIELDKLYDILNKNDNKALALLHHDVISYWNKLNDLFKLFVDCIDKTKAIELIQFNTISKNYDKYSKNFLDFYNSQICKIQDMMFSNNLSGFVPIQYVPNDNNGRIDIKQEYLIKEADFDNDLAKFNYCCFDLNSLLEAKRNFLSSVCCYKARILDNISIDEKKIIDALKNDYVIYAKLMHKTTERMLRSEAQKHKTQRNDPLNHKVWSEMQKVEDEKFNLAIKGKLKEYQDSNFDSLDSEQRIKLENNFELLQKIINIILDEELFDFDFSVKTCNIDDVLNEDNIELFFELVLRRDLIQSKMFDSVKKQFDAMIEKTENKKLSDGILPEELRSDEAQRLWSIAKENCWVDESFQLKISQNEASLLAMAMFQALNIKNQWNLFEKLWGVNDLCSKHSHIVANSNHYHNRLEVYKSAFHKKT